MNGARRHLALATLVGLLFALPALAGYPDSPGKQAKGMEKAEHGKMQTIHLIRGKELLGTTVKNKEGNKLGTISDIVIDLRNHRINYAALSTGGVLGFGDDMFAVAWNAFEMKHAGMETGMRAGEHHGEMHGEMHGEHHGEMHGEKHGEMHGEKHGEMHGEKHGEMHGEMAGKKAGEKARRKEMGKLTLVLDTSQESLEHTDGFDEDQWPTDPNQRWGDGDRAGEVRYGGTGEDEPDNRRLTKIRGLEAKNRGEKMGMVEDVVFDAAAGRPAYALVNIDRGFWEEDSDQVLVPWTALKTAEGTITMDLEHSAFRQMTFAEDDLERLEDRSHAEKIHRTAHADPYWTAGQEMKDERGHQHKGYGGEKEKTEGVKEKKEKEKEKEKKEERKQDRY